MCHLNFKLNFPSLYRNKKKTSILSLLQDNYPNYFLLLPHVFPNKNQMKPIEPKKWSNPQETSRRFSYPPYMRNRIIGRFHHSRGKLLDEEGTNWQLPWEVERKQLLSAPASHFCSNRDRDEEKFGLGSWVKLLSLWHGMEKREGGRIVERRGRKERRKINKERFLKNSCYWKTRCRLVWI